MPPYLLKRILYAIPFLWLVASVIFLLSRLLPGSFAEARILEEKQGYYSKGSQSTRQAVYQDYLHKTRQDLPLFYFSLSPALPQGVLLEADKLQAERLLWKYGDKEAVHPYLESLPHLEQELRLSPQDDAAEHLETLHKSLDKEKMLLAATAIYREATTKEAQKAAEQVVLGLQAMQPQPAYSFLLPTFTWHGAQNQYHQWLFQTLKGDLGVSYRSSRPVGELLWEAISNTFWLLLSSMLIVFFLALELSMCLVQGKGKYLRRFLFPSFFVLDSIPAFVLALLLLVLFANPSFLQLFPVFGMGYYAAENLPPFARAGQWLQYMALPLLCLVLANLPYITNQVYTAVQSARQADYARTARAKGLSERAVIRTHVLRNALLPVITLVSDVLPALVAGSVIIETIFAIPGVGRLLVESVLARDYPVLLAIVLLTVLVRLVAYFMADVTYRWADPRLKHRTA
ncbi:peptide/nickel transport system permease protein [Pontibacter ummariensis]|uniref:Peptide/nickel transport system permease protein n=1 Tax=Pontibacter ummariensis TaxID=1610492 RepID=A0A239JWU7_9BACT|nr:ABC transporter permease [Pontibacter ummariensis]PRY07309.1 peptide/nickel transport system permease protein [Pontibacter ummariensis]SNT09948.1 peptide/nickel transport system permease protein [Pontibacter ummariensis]